MNYMDIRYRRWGIFVLTILLSIPSFGVDYRFYLKDYGVRPDKDWNNSAKLRVALEGIKSKIKEGDAVTLVLERGRYEFGREGAAERTLYISNHDHEPIRSVGLLLEGFSRLTIEGNGAELYFLDRMLPIALEGCRKVELRGLTIDFAHPQISEVRIIENKGAAGTIIEPSPQVQWRIAPESGELECYGRDWSNRPFTGIAFESKTGHIVYRTADLDCNTKNSENLGGGRVACPRWVDERLEAGTIVAMRTYHRPQPAIFVDASSDIYLKEINIHYADGMGLLAQNSHNISLNALRVVPRPSQNRLYSTTQADATHFSGCSGLIDVRRSTFEGMMDDAINVHGIYLKLIKRIDDYTLEARYMHDQAFGMEWGQSGDSIQFVGSDTFEVLDSGNTLRSIQSAISGESTIGAKTLRLTFASPLPAEITPSRSIGIENLRKTPSVVFSYNVIRNNRARGTLLNTPKPILVSHNIFDHISGSAILVSSDCNQWFESGQTKYLTIRNNLFFDVLTSVFQFTEAVISLYPVIPRLDAQKKPFYGDGGSGIVIEDNTFITFDTPLLFAQSVDGIRWQRNKVFDSKSYPRFHWNKTPFVLKGSRSFIHDTE